MVTKLRIQNILFDFDGTLADTRQGIADSFNYSLEKNGFSKIEDKEVHDLIGAPLHGMFAAITKSKDKELIERCVADYRSNYQEICVKESFLLPGVRETLEYFKSKDKTIAIATTKPLKFALHLLKNFEIFDYFHIIEGSEIAKGKPEKTKHELLSSLSTRIDFSRPTVMIGDTGFDIEAGKEFGIMTVGVTTGTASREELTRAGADFVVDSIKELVGMIE